MAREIVNLGTGANDGTGDPLRTAFEKINNNFSELYSETAADSQISFSGNKISANASNADLVLEASGTGAVQLGALKVVGTTINSDDSTQVTIAENLHVTGNITGTFTGDGSSLTGITATALSTPATVDNLILNDNIISSASNADINITPGGTGSVNIMALTVDGTEISSSDSTQVTIKENLNVTGDVTATAYHGDGSNLTGISADSIGDLSVAGSTISAPSNADLTLNAGGTGSVDIEGIQIKGTEISSTDSSQVTIKENLHVTGNITGTLTGSVAFSNVTSTPTTLSGYGITDAASSTATAVTVVGDDSTGTAVTLGESFKIAGTQNVTTAVSGDVLTITGPDLSSYLTDITLNVVADDSATIALNNNGTLLFNGEQNITTSTDSSGVVTITGPDLTSYITASSSDTLTNKTIDANGTGNSISNIEVADFAAASIVTEAEGIGSNDNDTTIPTSAAVKDYVDSSEIGTGDLTITGSTISSPSNADITLAPGGTGSVSVDAIQIKGTEISSTDSTQVTIKENLHVTGALTVAGSTLSGTLNTAGNTGTGSVALASESLQVTGTTNEINVDAAAFALSLSLADDISGIVSVTASSFLANDAIKIVDNHITGTRSNEDIVLKPNGTGQVVLNQIKSDDSSAIQINDSVNVSGGMTVAGGDLVTADISSSGNIDAVGFTSTGNSTFDGVQISDNTITSASSNADLIINASGTGTIVLENLKVGTGATVTTILDEDNMASNSDTALATQQSIKAYVDSEISGVSGASTGDLAITGSTISAPSNADLTLNAGGTGSVDIEGIQIKGTEISSSDSTQVTIKENLHVTGNISGTITGTIDADSSTVSNLEVDNFKATAIVTESEGIGSNDNDTTIPTSAAVKDYVDSNPTTSLAADNLTTGDAAITITTTTGDITLDTQASNRDIIFKGTDGGVDITPFQLDMSEGGKAIFQADIQGQGVTISDNTITSNRSDDNLELDANGTGQVVSNAAFKFNAGYIEKINTLTSSSTITVDCSAASIHTVTLGTATEFNITNLPTGGSVTLIITQDGTGGRTATFGTDGSSAVKFPSNSSTLSTGAADIDVVTIINDGTNFLGNIAKDYRSS